MLDFSKILCYGRDLLTQKARQHTPVSHRGMQAGCQFSHRDLYPFPKGHLHVAVQIDCHSVNRRVPKLR